MQAGEADRQTIIVTTLTREYGIARGIVNFLVKHFLRKFHAILKKCLPHAKG